MNEMFSSTAFQEKNYVECIFNHEIHTIFDFLIKKVPIVAKALKKIS